MTSAEALAAVEARLGPYGTHLDPNPLYGLPTLRWPGAKAHDFFAGVRRAERHVAFHLMPVITHPALVDAMPQPLRKHLTGKATFTFTALDDRLVAQLEALVERSFETYSARQGLTGQTADVRSLPPLCNITHICGSE